MQELTKEQEAWLARVHEPVVAVIERLASAGSRLRLGRMRKFKERLGLYIHRLYGNHDAETAGAMAAKRAKELVRELAEPKESSNARR